ncbi:MAG: hypothetical protein WCC12_01450 [Anaerolineales bacterium]
MRDQAEIVIIDGGIYGVNIAYHLAKLGKKDNGAPVWAQRASYVSELGWELYVRPSCAVMVWDMLMEAGQAFGIEVGGYRVLDSLRLKKRYHYFTTDITPLDNPYQSGQGFCVQLDKGDFTGRDALLKHRQAVLYWMTRKARCFVHNVVASPSEASGEAISSC